MLRALMLSTLIAQASSPMQAYHAYVTPRFEPFGTSGELKISLRSNGYVVGTYTTDTGGRTFAVLGGYDGDKIWFDYGGMHVDGTIKNGVITGLASSNGPANRTYTFTAKAETTPSPGRVPR